MYPNIADAIVVSPSNGSIVIIEILTIKNQINLFIYGVRHAIDKLMR